MIGSILQLAMSQAWALWKWTYSQTVAVLNNYQITFINFQNIVVIIQGLQRELDFFFFL